MKQELGLLGILAIHGGEDVNKKAGVDAKGGDLYLAQRMLPPQANVRPVYADLKRPFDIDAPVPQDVATALLTEAGHPIAANPRNLKEWIGKYPDQTLSGLKVYTALQARIGKDGANALLAKHGYDGITHMGGAITGGQPHKVYIAFSPENVYPSFNVDALRSPQ